MSKKLALLAVTGVGLVLLIAFSLKPPGNSGKQPGNTVAAPTVQATAPEIGYLAPDFTLKTLDGKMVSLRDLRGKPVFIIFWASWCDSCKLEMPELEKFYEGYKNNIAFLAINITFNDNLTEVQKYLSTIQATFPVLLDEDSKNSITESYQVNAISTSFFIDKDGVIRDIHFGPMMLNDLKSSIKKAM